MAVTVETTSPGNPASRALSTRRVCRECPPPAPWTQSALSHGNWSLWTMPGPDDHGLLPKSRPPRVGRLRLTRHALRHRHGGAIMGSDRGLIADQRADAGAHPCRTTRLVEGGSTASRRAGRMGRRTSSPPQFGQTPCRTFPAQSRHQVHSYVQMSTSGDARSRSRSQHSQFGRSSST
jgi:hypothetical protein